MTMKIYEGYGAIDHLEVDGKLTSYDYSFLKGDKVEWPPRWGAAFGIVFDWCRKHGYGGFGEPTERGIEAMLAYEREQLMVHP